MIRVRASELAVGDLPVVRFDPKNPQIVYSASIVCWKSTDSSERGRLARRAGRPGDDYRKSSDQSGINTDIILLGSDQGAIVTVNGRRLELMVQNQSTARLLYQSARTTPFRIGLQRATGKRFGRNQKSWRRRREYVRDWQP